jgi:hypothetical protein
LGMSSFLPSPSFLHPPFFTFLLRPSVFHLPFSTFLPSFLHLPSYTFPSYTFLPYNLRIHIYIYTIRISTYPYIHISMYPHASVHPLINRSIDL